jgi:hypothetical protein
MERRMLHVRWERMIVRGVRAGTFRAGQRIIVIVVVQILLALEIRRPFRLVSRFILHALSITAGVFSRGIDHIHMNAW